MKKAIDLYHLDNIENWDLLKEHVSLVILKCAQGSLSDPLCWQRIHKCLDLKIPIMLYYFVDGEASTEAQVQKLQDWMAATENLGVIKKIAIDVEVVNGKPGPNTETIRQLIIEARKWSEPLIYGNKDDLEQYMPQGYTITYLWLANYNSGLTIDTVPKPSNAQKVAMWQYTSTATIEGVISSCDLSYISDWFAQELEL